MQLLLDLGAAATTAGVDMFCSTMLQCCSETALCKRDLCRIISSYVPTAYRSEDWQCSDNYANVGEEEVGGDLVDEEEIVDDEEEEED